METNTNNVMIKNIVESEFNRLSPKETHEIVKDALKEYLKYPNTSTEIDINNLLIKNIIESEINKFSPEEIHDIAKDALKEYLKNEGVMNYVLFTQTARGSVPSDTLKHIMQNVAMDSNIIRDNIKSEINKFSPEEIHEIAKGGLKDYLKNPNAMKDILFEPTPYSYTYNPSPILKSMMKQVVENSDDKYFHEIAKEFVDYLKNNYDKIIKELINVAIIEKIRETIVHSNQFECAVTNILNREMNGN